MLHEQKRWCKKGYDTIENTVPIFLLLQHRLLTQYLKASLLIDIMAWNPSHWLYGQFLFIFSVVLSSAYINVVNMFTPCVLYYPGFLWGVPNDIVFVTKRVFFNNKRTNEMMENLAEIHNFLHLFRSFKVRDFFMSSWAYYKYIIVIPMISNIKFS